MLRHTNVRRSLAVAAIIAVGTLSTGALPATADQGNGKGRGAEHSTAKNDKDRRQGSRQRQGPAGHHQGWGVREVARQARQGGEAEQARVRSGKRQQAGKPDKLQHRPERRHSDKGGKGAGKDRVPGNNGTVKITPLGETDGTPNNHPHVGCSFQIEWYGYDKGDDIVSQVGFAMHAPTSNVGLSVSGPSSVFVGGDAASGAGTATGLDGREAYTLSFDGAGHPKQGYHVKVTVPRRTPQGNDTKTKVFWVQGCDDTEVPPWTTAGRQPADRQPADRGAAGDNPPVDLPPRSRRSSSRPRSR